MIDCRRIIQGHLFYGDGIHTKKFGLIKNEKDVKIICGFRWRTRSKLNNLVCRM